MDRRQFCGTLLGAAATIAAPTVLRAQAKSVIRVGNIDIGPFVPIAYTKKLEAKHGLDIQITTFRRGLEAAQALKAREIDVAVGGLEAGISSAGANTPTIIVSSVSNKALSWVGRSDMKWNSVADLKGKRFGCIRGVHELVARVVFANEGITASEERGKGDVQFIFIPNSPGLVNALKIRELDATSAPEPFPARAVQEGYASPLLNPFNTVLGNLPRAVFMHRAFHDENTAVAQRFVDAVVEATKVFRDTPAIGRDFALNDALKGAITAEDWDLAMKNQDFDVDLSDAVVQAHIDQMLKFEMLRKPLKSSEITDLAMLEKAKRNAGW